MLMAIGMVVLGLGLIFVAPGFAPDPISRLIFVVLGAAVLIASAIVIIIAKLYQRTSANEAFVRTGMGGRRVVLDGGCIVVPVVHKIVPVSLETMKLEVERIAEDALITKDNLRCDIRGEFYIKVQAVGDDILNASRSLGDRSVDAPCASWFSRSWSPPCGLLRQRETWHSSTRNATTSRTLYPNWCAKTSSPTV